MPGGSEVVLTGEVKFKPEPALKYHRNTVFYGVGSTRVSNNNIIGLLNNSLPINRICQSQNVDTDGNQGRRNQSVTHELLDSCVGR
jgi:hypothetical protein